LTQNIHPIIESLYQNTKVLQSLIQKHNFDAQKQGALPLIKERLHLRYTFSCGNPPLEKRENLQPLFSNTQSAHQKFQRQKIWSNNIEPIVNNIQRDMNTLIRIFQDNISLKKEGQPIKMNLEVTQRGTILAYIANNSSMILPLNEQLNHIWSHLLFIAERTQNLTGPIWHLSPVFDIEDNQPGTSLTEFERGDVYSTRATTHIDALEWGLLTKFPHTLERPTYNIRALQDLSFDPRP
jgi:hypothetical protein